MTYEIYIDSIFFMNFIMNILILILTAKTLHRTATRWEVVKGSAAGALGYCIILCLPVSYFFKIIIGFIPVSIGTARITFRSRGVKNILRETGYMFVYTFLLGAFMLYWLRRVPFLREYSGKIWCVLGISYVSYAVFDYFLKKYRNKKSDPFCKVMIPCNQEVITVTALVDTGNGLREPVSGKPVAVLEEKVWEGLKPLMREDKFRVIPYHSVGNSHGLMEGYELASIIVEKEAQRECYEKVIVGICKEQISMGEQYQMILSPELLEH